MSLLNGRDVVVVTPKVRVEDSMGTTLVDGEPIRVTGVSIQSTAGSAGLVNEYQTGGQVRSTFAIFGRKGWPGGPNSTVLVETGPYAGKVLDQDGETAWFTRSRATAHYEVQLTARAPEVH